MAIHVRSVTSVPVIVIILRPYTGLEFSDGEDCSALSSELPVILNTNHVWVRRKPPYNTQTKKSNLSIITVDHLAMPDSMLHFANQPIKKREKKRRPSPMQQASPWAAGYEERRNCTANGSTERLCTQWATPATLYQHSTLTTAPCGGMSHAASWRQTLRSTAHQRIL